MKVLVISHTYIASINREKWKIFAKRYPNTQLKILIPKCWKATLFDIQAGDLFADSLKNCKFISLDIFNSGNEVLYGYGFLGIAKLLINFKPDLIHVEQGDNAFSYFQAILLSKIFCRKAKFCFFTWVNWKQKRSWKYNFFWNFIEKFNLFFSDGAFVGNHDAKVILQNKNFKKSIQVLLQLGVNQNFFRPTEKALESTKKIIGYVGRLLPEKGIFLLVDAFTGLIKNFPDWRLLFVGNGKSERKLREYVKDKNILDYVEFRPAMPHEKVAEVLNELEILVLPSYDTAEWREQFGHVLIEAMSCKIPVIGSTGGQIPQVIGNAGLIFEQKNEMEMMSCLKKLMQDQVLRKKLGQSGYERFKSNYSYEIIADKTYSFWSKFLQEP